jgi:hypothetical protein
VRVRLALATSLLALAFTAALAQGAQVVQDRRGDFRSRGLGPADRKALDIQRVSVVNAGRGYFIVTARMAGNLERRVGKGRLREAAAALVIRPRRGRPAALATGGAEGREIVAQRRLDTASVVRDGRNITLLVSGVRQPARITVRTTADVSRRGRRARAAQLGAAEFLVWALTRPLTNTDGDQSSTAPKPQPSKCDELKSERDKLLNELRELDAKLRLQRDLPRARARTEAQIDNLEKSLRALDKRIEEACTESETRSKTVTITTRCPDKVDDAAVTYAFDVFIPSGARNVRHRFVRPAAGPICPGIPDDGFPGTLEFPAQPPPPVRAGPNGETPARIRLRVDPHNSNTTDTTADGEQVTVTIEVTWN